MENENECAGGELVRVSVRMPADLHQHLTKTASRESRSLNGQIVHQLKTDNQAHHEGIELAGHVIRFVNAQIRNGKAEDNPSWSTLLKHAELVSGRLKGKSPKTTAEE